MQGNFLLNKVFGRPPTAQNELAGPAVLPPILRMVRMYLPMHGSPWEPNWLLALSCGGIVSVSSASGLTAAFRIPCYSNAAARCPDTG